MRFKTQGKIAVAAIVVAVCAGVIFLMKKFAPEAEKETREEVLTTVEVATVESLATSVRIQSQGMVEALTETSLAAEVGGTVVSVSENFEVGREFEKDDVILEIDPADYASALAQMESNVADAELNLALEKGLARNAPEEWRRLGREGEPTDLALRKPQLKSAEAKLVSARAAVEKARRDLDRTKIRAPYDCRIRMTYTEVGSFLGPGTRIADIYELGDFEIRLPISLDEYAFIDGSGTGAGVTFSANIAGEEYTWKGTVIRDEGVVDRTSRSVFLVASITEDQGSKFLSPGLFVKASIAGRKLDNVISLPRKALYGKDRVYVIDDEDRLRFRKVTILRTERDRVLVSDGLEAGERVCTTNLAAAIDKMKVRIVTEPETETARSE